MNATNDNSEGSRLEDGVAGGIILIIASISFVLNGATTALMVRVKYLRNSFGFLCVSQGVADCGVLIIFALWCAPVTLSQSLLSTGVVGKKIGQLSLFFWFGGIYSTLLIGVNRFFAISFPVRYRKAFTDRNTIFLIILCWILATFHAILYFFDGCDFFYDPSTYVWQYDTTPCGNFASFYLDFCFGVASFAIIFIFNVLTAAKLHLSNKQQLASQVASQTASEIRDQEKRRKREIRFFVQACINGASFNIMLISFHLLSRYAWDKWSLFATTSLIWQLAHASNGIVFLVFNRDLRQLILQPKHICKAPERNVMNGTSHVNMPKKSVVSIRTIPVNNFLE
uniref:G-protein coupled receptors family 1 profile domain-containing protein n=1 Tax=Plectus sambesii TaxID=2011161 RepID=A0A914UJ77_9BILA